MDQPAHDEPQPAEVQALGEPFAVYQGRATGSMGHLVAGSLALAATLGAITLAVLYQGEYTFFPTLSSKVFYCFGIFDMAVCLFWISRGKATAGVLTALGAVICVMQGLTQSEKENHRYVIAVSRTWYICSIFFLLLAFALFSLVPRLKRCRYFLCPDGLARTERNSVATMPWNGLQVFVNYDPTVEGNFDTLRLENGTKKWVLHHNVANLADLFEQVNDSIATVEREQLLAAIQRGEPATFGPMEVSRRSITLNGKKLAWEDVGAIGDTVSESKTGPIRKFTVTLTNDSREWGAVEAQLVPNHELLFDLIREIQPQVLASGE
jgi:hypothetical protein